ncbi:MAG: MFS transporter, partial [Anaerolineae bacterium]|nr:MFS transporter [Anaerolineae bacterium]
MSAFVRDRYTWLSYGLLAFYSFHQTAFGPIMPFLRDELKMSFTVAGMHSSAFAIGMITAGALAEPLTRRWGRWSMLWNGGAGLVAGAILFALARDPRLTIASAFVMGTLGSLLLTTIQATLGDLHGERRTVAVVEANIAASAAAMLGALLIGWLATTPLGWRAVMFLMVGVFGLLFFTNQSGGATPPSPPADPAEANPTDSRLPATFWLIWLITALGWRRMEPGLLGAEYMNEVAGLPRGTAAGLMSLFFLSAVLARWLSSRLAQRFSLHRLLLAAWGFSLVGFVLFWLALHPVMTVAGLFLGGFGVANLYPLGLSAALGAVPGRLSGAASARMAMCGGSPSSWRRKRWASRQTCWACVALMGWHWCWWCWRRA